MEKKPYYITTAIAYTSRTPHIGNTYEAVLTDSIARYHRLKGEEVFFMTGTDEHGQKIQQQAEAEGLTPQEHVDKIAGEVKEIWDMMNTSYDKFIRTTDADHKLVVQKIFEKLYQQGDIYKGKYEGLYCTSCESFFTTSQLVDGKCPDCGGPVHATEEEAYFLCLSKYQDRLMKHIEENPHFIQPESRKNEMINNFLKPGLQDLCVSRTSFTWGVPVRIDKGHVIYVWIDALSNYITGIGYDPDGSSEFFHKYWPADVHVIGKDILRFHTLYWPIMLMALDLPLPKQVFGHPWLLMGGDKMSKSKGNTIYAKDLVERYGVDATRFYLLHEMPFASDGSLTYELMIQRINSDLANILGNLVNRTIAMQKKYFGGEILAPTAKNELDTELIQMALDAPKQVESKMEELRVADAMDVIWALLRRTNKYIDETEPWILAKEEKNKERLGTVMYHLLEAIRFSAVLLQPFLPETAEKIFAQINSEKKSLDSLESFDGMVSGSHVGEAEVLFARIDEQKELAEVEKIIEQKLAAAQANTQEQAKLQEEQKEERPEITIDDFAKIDLRVGHILECKRHPKADKLLVSQVKMGDEIRQIVSGVAAHYTPEEMVGKEVAVVANLAPIKLRGELSQGMILFADTADGKLKAVTFDGSVESGMPIK